MLCAVDNKATTANFDQVALLAEKSSDLVAFKLPVLQLSAVTLKRRDLTLARQPALAMPEILKVNLKLDTYRGLRTFV